MAEDGGMFHDGVPVDESDPRGSVLHLDASGL